MRARLLPAAGLGANVVPATLVRFLQAAAGRAL